MFHMTSTTNINVSYVSSIHNRCFSNVQRRNNRFMNVQSQNEATTTTRSTETKRSSTVTTTKRLTSDKVRVEGVLYGHVLLDIGMTNVTIFRTNSHFYFTLHGFEGRLQNYCQLEMSSSCALLFIIIYLLSNIIYHWLHVYHRHWLDVILGTPP